MAGASPFDGLMLTEVLGQLAGREGFRLLRNMAGPVIERAYSTDPAGSGSLADIEHIVLLMQDFQH